MRFCLSQDKVPGSSEAYRLPLWCDLCPPLCEPDAPTIPVICYPRAQNPCLYVHLQLPCLEYSSLFSIFKILGECHLHETFSPRHIQWWLLQLKDQTYLSSHVCISCDLPSPWYPLTESVMGKVWKDQGSMLLCRLHKPWLECGFYLSHGRGKSLSLKSSRRSSLRLAEQGCKALRMLLRGLQEGS